MFWSTSLILFATFASAVASSPSKYYGSSSKDSPKTEILTQEGPIQGYFNKSENLVRYIGVRYAASPEGELRWKKPAPPPKHKDVFIADKKQAVSCYQALAHRHKGVTVESEDCLRLNINVPINVNKSITDLLPVYIYAYGGGFIGKTAHDPVTDTGLMAHKGFIGVNINYRLGVLGAPRASALMNSTDSQNFAIYDARSAIEWVRDNIEAFGGDPKKITFGGESAGALLVDYYAMTFAKDPIVRGLIVQSSGVGMPSWEDNMQLDILAKNMSCPTGLPALDCLSKKSAADLTKATIASGANFYPYPDDKTVFRAGGSRVKNGLVADTAYLIGTAYNEGSSIKKDFPHELVYNFTKWSTSGWLNYKWADPVMMRKYYPVPSEKYPADVNATVASQGDSKNVCYTAQQANNRVALGNKNVYRYVFAQDALACHGCENTFVFGSMELMDSGKATPEQLKMSGYIQQAWVDFILDPDRGITIDGWPRYAGKKSKSVAWLGVDGALAAVPHSPEDTDQTCEFWDQYMDKFPVDYHLNDK